jgi:hypothetical protein
MVETRVVRHEHASIQSPHQFRGDFFEAWCVCKHVVVDAGERANPQGYTHSGVHEAAPLEVEPVTRRADHSDLDHAVARGTSTGRFNVDERNRCVGRNVQLSSIHVVLSSVYLSKACSDLSRPMPDCLNPPNGTVMSSAS